ncbi:MAG: sugar ABC transporter permease [Verrucomicrobia bacterium]|nr:sugar ABC transporter permease [Verrucomicrobiota bacterium]
MATGQQSSDGLMKWGLVAPALLLLIGLNIFPLAYNIRLSFTKATLTQAPADHEAVGGRNYARIFKADESNRYAAALRTTARFVLMAVSIELLLGYLLALSLKPRFPGKSVVLLVFLIPMMLSPAVMALFWNLIYDEEFGVLNQALRFVGFASVPGWKTDTAVKFYTILMIDVWMWTPFMMLISMAALNAIPDYIYEAAEIDRARRWTVFRRITLPMSAPLLILAALLRTTDALKQFDYVMAITGPNDPATETLSTLMYQVMFRNFKVGLGSAYAIVVLVIVIAVATLFIRYLDRLREQEHAL